MKISDYIFTPKDIWSAFSSFTNWQWIGVAFSAVVFFSLSFLFSFDVAALLAGIVVMTAGRLKPEIPLYLAIAGLVSLMLMSFVVEEDNNWERLSDNVAVFVFFMMIFGVYKMTIDHVYDAWINRNSPSLDTEPDFIDTPVAPAVHTPPHIPKPFAPEPTPTRPAPVHRAPTKQHAVRPIMPRHTAHPRPTDGSQHLSGILRPAAQPIPKANTTPVQKTVPRTHHVDLSKSQQKNANQN